MGGGKKKRGEKEKVLFENKEKEGHQSIL